MTHLAPIAEKVEMIRIKMLMLEIERNLAKFLRKMLLKLAVKTTKVCVVSTRTESELSTL
jgi:hypothetical protein